MKNESWGRGEHANMPKEVKMKPYPPTPMGKDRPLDDSLTGIDSCNKQMVGMRNKNVSYQK